MIFSHASRQPSGQQRASRVHALRGWATAACVALLAGASGGCQQQGEWVQGIVLLGALAALSDSAERYHTLTINITGSGEVREGDAVYQSATSTRRLRRGTMVSLRVQEVSGHTFQSWTGACTGSDTSCTVTMNASREVTANFSASSGPARSLTLIVTGPGAITYDGATYIASSVITDIADGTDVLLSASATASAATHAWGGACSGTGATCSLRMDQDRTARLDFTAATGIASSVAGPPADIVVPGAVSLGFRAELAVGATRLRWDPEPAARYRVNVANPAGGGAFSVLASQPRHIRELSVALDPSSAAWLNSIYLLETCDAAGRCQPARQAQAQLVPPPTVRSTFRVGELAVWAAARRGDWLALARYPLDRAATGQLFLYRHDGSAWLAPQRAAGLALPSRDAAAASGALAFSGDASDEVGIEWAGRAPLRFEPLPAGGWQRRD